MCQIRPPNLPRSTKLRKLIRLLANGRRDIAPGASNWSRDIALLLANLRPRPRMIARQGIRAAQMERATLARRRAVRDFLGRDGAVGADLAGGDSHGFVAEHEAGEDVEDAEDDDDDAAGDDDLPGAGAEGFFRRGGFVQVAEDGDAEDYHEGAEGDEARAGGEEGPGAGEVGAEEGEFGEDECHWGRGYVLAWLELAV